MKLFRKKIPAPVTNDVRDVEVAKTWRVEWESRYGVWTRDTQTECEFFLSREEAERFAESLRMAFKLIRHTAGTNVVVRENLTPIP